MILSIDPSINNVGVCVQELDDNRKVIEYDKNWVDLKSKGIFSWWEVKVPQAELLQDRCDYLVEFLPPSSDISELVIEYPMFMGGSDRGNIAAQKGYTIDLGCVCGYLMAYYQPCKVHLYTPNQWKGQMPKSATEARFNKIFGKQKRITDHEQDATMLLYWHLNGKMVP